MTKIGARTRTCLAVASIILLSACAREPSFTSVEAWRQNATSNTVAICYSPEIATQDQLATLAVTKCPANTQSLRVIEDSALLNNCPISKRFRVIFQCVTQ